jgi:hypothetical protein
MFERLDPPPHEADVRVKPQGARVDRERPPKGMVAET